MLEKQSEQGILINERGVLITVLSLLLLIVYTEGDYTAWDVIIAAAATYFGWSYLRDKSEKDRFSCLIGCFITGAGLLISIVGFIGVFNPTVREFSETRVVDWIAIDRLFASTLILAVSFWIFVSWKSK